MKRIYLIVLLLITSFSCTESGDILGDNLQQGALIIFETVPSSDERRISVLRDVSEYSFSAAVLDPRNNVTNYSLRLIYGDIIVNDFIVLTSFPNVLEFTGSDILSALNITQDEIDVGVSLQLIATLTTVDNVFDGALTDFNLDDNVQEGGGFFRCFVFAR